LEKKDKILKMSDIPNPSILWVIYDKWREDWDKKQKIKEKQR